MVLGFAMTSRGPKGVYCGKESCGDVLGEGVDPLSVGVELFSVGVELDEVDACLDLSGPGKPVSELGISPAVGLCLCAVSPGMIPFRSENKDNKYHH